MKKKLEWIDVEALVKTFRDNLSRKVAGIEEEQRKSAESYEKEVAQLQRVFETGETDDENEQNNVQRELSQFFHVNDKKPFKLLTLAEIENISGELIVVAVNKELNSGLLKSGIERAIIIALWYSFHGNSDQRAGAEFALSSIRDKLKKSFKFIKWYGEVTAKFNGYDDGDLFRMYTRLRAARQMDTAKTSRAQWKAHEATTRRSYAGHADWHARSV